MVKNKITFEIEHYNGETYMAFELYIKDDGSINIRNTENCNLADISNDYIFDTENSLYRIQADKPISILTYEDIQNCYNDVNIDKLLELYHSHKSNCCKCGCTLEDSTGSGLGSIFILDYDGNFYCMNCDNVFDDEDERIFEAEIYEEDQYGKKRF